VNRGTLQELEVAAAKARAEVRQQTESLESGTVVVSDGKTARAIYWALRHRIYRDLWKVEYHYSFELRESLDGPFISADKIRIHVTRSRDNADYQVANFTSGFVRDAAAFPAGMPGRSTVYGEATIGNWQFRTPTAVQEVSSRVEEEHTGK